MKMDFLRRPQNKNKVDHLSKPDLISLKFQTEALVTKPEFRNASKEHKILWQTTSKCEITQNLKDK